MILDCILPRPHRSMSSELISTVLAVSRALVVQGDVALADDGFDRRLEHLHVRPKGGAKEWLESHGTRESLPNLPGFRRGLKFASHVCQGLEVRIPGFAHRDLKFESLVWQELVT